jgi:RNA polymerase sigma-70 factor, ECF subfamily
VRHGSNPAGYLYRVAFRLLSRPSRPDDVTLGDTDVASTDSTPEDQAVASLLTRAALDAMPARRRACAALVWYLGFTADEAGAILGIDGATVRTQLERARRAASAPT